MNPILKSPLAALGAAAIAAFAITGCGNTDGSHNMGDNKNYKPMPDKDMPSHKSSSGGSSDGSHNMGDNKNYKPMADKDMPAR